MKFIILRLLTSSELGMFHEYRRSGREVSKQRAINYDWDVVDRVFPSAKDSDRIAITCRCLDDEKTVVMKDQWLKKQDKNWRLEGFCPTSSYYGFVEPGVLFAMVVDASSTPASGSWVVIPTDHPARTAIINHGESSRLTKSAMIALHGDEGTFCRSILAEHYPQLFEKVKTVSYKPRKTDGLEPDPIGLFNILASAGHRLPSAVADLVDNSISKGASEIDITFPNPNQGGRWMCIRDNGIGMKPEVLREAMRIGYQAKRDASDLGKYGYGLKGASWSQADRLTVVSKAKGFPESVLSWDKDHLALTGGWHPLEEAVEDRYAEVVSLGASGTAVLLTKMRPPIDPPKAKGVEPYVQEVASIRDHLELVFHRFLQGRIAGREQVSITLNGEPLQANDPMGHPLTKSFDPRSIQLEIQQQAEKPSITVRAFVLPNEEEFEEYHRRDTPIDRRQKRDRLTLNGRWNESQGFYFYRLDRLIKWGGWENLFAVDEKLKLLRVAVDFDRMADESLQVDISKQIIRLPLSLTKQVEEVLKGPRSEARSRYNKKSQPTGSNRRNSTPQRGSSPGASGPADGAEPAVDGTKTTAPSASKTKPARQERSPLRLVEGGSVPWERKTGFAGEQVEISQRIPELVSLVQSIDKDMAAKKALSDFLRVLEQAGVVRILDERSNAK